MAQGMYTWSMTAASNANADATIDWREGMAPSAVNDSARSMMARLCEWRNDVSGITVTGGTATAYTITTNQVFASLSNLSNQMVAFVPHATNTNTVGNDITLAVDGLAAKPIRAQPSVALPNGSLILGTPYIVTYNNSDAVFYLQGMTNPYSIPLAGGMDYWGSTAPNSSFVFPIGQAISRTTYATLFSLLSTTYGTGDGSTTFNLPDKSGRISAMKEASATRLTSTYFVGNSTAIGAVGGGESSTLITANLPAYTPSGTNTANTTTQSAPNSVNAGFVFGTAGATGIGWQNGIGPTNSVLNVAGQTFTGTAQGGTSTPVRTVQPTIICNYIIRVL